MEDQLDQKLTWAILLAKAQAMTSSRSRKDQTSVLYETYSHGGSKSAQAGLLDLRRLEVEHKSGRFVPDTELRKTLKRCQHHLLENRILSELSAMASGLVEGLPASKQLKFPHIASPSPMKPSKLFDRVLDHRRLPNADEPRTRMSSSSTSNSRSMASTQTDVYSLEMKNRKIIQEAGYKILPLNIVPHLNYAQSTESQRNLPIQPELIRLLSDPEIHFGSRRPDDIDQSQTLHSVSGSISPPLISNIKEKINARRKLLCKICKKPPGSHQLWCEYYDFGDKKTEEQTEWKKPPTVDLSSVFSKRPKTPPPPPKIKKVKPRYEVPPVDMDRPDYRSIHRDVYIHALALTRTRRMLRRTLKRAYDFTQQSTRPFVFSYFDNLESPEKKKGVRHEMRHIFGKGNTNFSDHYTRFVYEQMHREKMDRMKDT